MRLAIETKNLVVIELSVEVLHILLCYDTVRNILVSPFSIPLIQVYLVQYYLKSFADIRFVKSFFILANEHCSSSATMSRLQNELIRELVPFDVGRLVPYSEKWNDIL